MKKSTAGFALIETIVAIVLLSAVLGTAVSLLVGAGRASDRNRDRMTATFLAQEGLELARNARDTAWKFHLPYNCAFVEHPTPRCSEKIATDIFSTPPAFVPLPDNIGAQNLSKFRRQIGVSPSTNPDGIVATVNVFFPVSGNENESIKMSEILTNWRKK